MKITLESYKQVYTFESKSDDFSAQELLDQFTRLMVAAGYPPDVIQCDDGGHYECSYVDDWDKPEPEKEKKLVRNRIKCKKCGDTIESKSVHDYVTCKCGAVSTDGGLDYMKVSGNNEDWEDFSEWK